MNNLSEEELEFILKTKEKVENMNLFNKTEWTDKKKQYLLDNYRTKNFTEIAKDLDLTPSSVRSMASRLNIKRGKRHWEEWKINYLNQNYSNLNLSVEEMAEHLDETVESVKYYANDILNLKRSRLWTSEQEELLRKLYCEENKNIEFIAEKFNKNVPAVKSKVTRMKLKRNKDK